jgi:glycosyltransferase involved in cell wall biosynthesis
MKIVIICDWLVTLAGAENVLRELLTLFPDADLFAVVDFLSPQQRQFLFNKSAQTTFIQHLPFAKKYYRHYLPLMPLAIEQLDLSAYDLIFSTSHAVAKGVITGPDQLHISYVYTPMRYAWDLQPQYLRETGLNKNFRGLLVRYLLHKLRMWDSFSAQTVDHFLTSSQYIARRIQKFYRRQATIIAPPVDLKAFTPVKQKENYYVTASRLVPYKRIDLVVEAFKHLPNEKLIVIGEGPEFKKIQALASPNVSLLGYQSQTELIHYLQRAQAFIFASEEDFGIAPLEALACGTPVIALGKGGALETIRGLDHPQPSGIFFPEQTTTAILQAIASFKQYQTQLTMEACRHNAEAFSAQSFQTKVTQFVQTCWSQHQLNLRPKK